MLNEPCTLKIKLTDKSKFYPLVVLGIQQPLVVSSVKIRPSSDSKHILIDAGPAHRCTHIFTVKYRFPIQIGESLHLYYLPSKGTVSSENGKSDQVLPFRGIPYCTELYHNAWWKQGWCFVPALTGAEASILRKQEPRSSAVAVRSGRPIFSQ